jgi:myosin heavy subunit
LESLPVVEKVEAVSVAELVKEKEGLQAVNEANKIQRDNLENHAKLIARLETEKHCIDLEIQRLESLLKIEKDKLANKNTEIKSTKTNHEELAKTVAALVDKDLTDINERIKNADETNKQAQQYIDREAKQAEVTKFQTESDDYTAKLKKIADYKTEIVSKTKFPVDGLDFANGGVIYKGIPFKQASTAQALKVSTAIGMALNPKLRVMLIDGAESLDSTQMGYIAEMAKDQDYQLWLTAVSEDEKVGIYIEDGEIKKVAE